MIRPVSLRPLLFAALVITLVIAPATFVSADDHEGVRPGSSTDRS